MGLEKDFKKLSFDEEEIRLAEHLEEHLRVVLVMACDEKGRRLC